MGLIKTQQLSSAAGSVMADQWKEFFYCESMPKEVLVTKGVKRTSGRSSIRAAVTTSSRAAPALRWRTASA